MSSATQQAFHTALTDLGGGRCGFIVPFDAARTSHIHDQTGVCGTVDGVPFSGMLVQYGGKVIMNIGSDIRGAIGKRFGDAVQVVMDLDTAPRGEEIPEDLIWALDMNEQAKARFDKFPASHRRAYVEWIEGARKPETRQRRLEQAIAMIVEGKKKV